MARTNNRPSLGTHTHDTNFDIRVRFAQQTDLDSLLELSLPSNMDSPIWNHIFPHLSRDRRIHPHYHTFKTLLRRHIKHSILDRSSFYLVAEKSALSSSLSSSSSSNPTTTPTPTTTLLLAAVCFEWIMDDPLASLRDRKLKVIFHTFLKRIVNAGEGKDHRYQFEPLRAPPVFGSYAEYVAYRQIRSESPCFDDTIAGFFSRHDVLDGVDEGTGEVLRQLTAGIEGLQMSVLLSTGRYREEIGEGSGVWVNTPFSLCCCPFVEAGERQAALGEMLNWMSDVVGLGEGPGWGLGGPDGVCLLFPDSQPHGWYENGWTDRFLESHNYRWVRRPVAEPVLEMPGYVGGEALEEYEMWFKEARSAPRRRGEWVRYRPEETYRLMEANETWRKRKRQEEGAFGGEVYCIVPLGEGFVCEIN